MEAQPQKEEPDPAKVPPSPTILGSAGSSLANQSLPAQIGRYRILEIIGSGGMGTVFKARDTELDRVVAIKVPRLELATSDLSQWRKRFIREARAAAKIRHPHVCPIFDVGEQNGTPFVVMAHVDGPSLSQCLSRENPYSNPIRAAGLIRQIAQALQAVHNQGLVHRDLKPANILIDRDDQAVLTDFGLARPDQDPEHLTQEGVLIGTPAFMAPEQAAGKNRQVGPRADLYSLGVVLYRLLTGRLPYIGTTVEVLRKIGHEPPPPPSQLCAGLDPALEDIVLKAMAPRPEDRFASGGELADALTGWLERRAGSSSTPQLEVPTKSFMLPGILPDSNSDEKKSATPDTDEMSRKKSSVVPRKNRPWIITSVVAIALIGAGLLIFVWNRNSPDPIIQGKGKHIAGLEIQPDGKGPRERTMSEAALVTAPAKIDGLSNWTLETRLPRGAVWALSFSPDSQWLALAGQDSMVRLWRRADRQLSNILVGHDRPVRRLAWSPDGKYLASAGDDGTVRLWHAERGLLLRTITDSVGAIHALAWSPDGLMLAGGGADKKVRIWKTTDGHLENVLETEGKVAALAWSPDGKLLAGAGNEKRIRLWQMPAGQGAPLLGGHDFPMIHDLAWLPDQTLVSAGQDNTIRFWSASTRRQLNFIPFPAPVTALTASPRENILAGGTVAGIGLWDSNGKQLESIGKAVGPVHALAWTPEGDQIAIVGREGTTRVWTRDNQPNWEIAAHPGGPCGASWSRDGKFLAICGFSDRALRLWETDQGRWRRQNEVQPCEPALAWSHDAKLLANGGFDGKVHLFDQATGQWRRAVPGHAGEVMSLAWAKNKIISVGAERTARLLDVAAEKSTRIFPAAASCVTWSPDGKYPTVGTGAGHYVWEQGFDKPPVQLHGKNSYIEAAAWTPDGRLLAEGSMDGEICVRTPGAWKVLATFSAHAPGALAALTWSPDGKTLASAGREGTLAFWDEHGKSLGNRKLPAPLRTLSWSGKCLAVTRDGAVAFINTETKDNNLLLIPLNGYKGLILTERGQFQAPAEKQLLVVVVVVQTTAGTQLMTSEEFAQKSKWRNDPRKATISP